MISGGATLPTSLHVHQAKSYLNPVLWGLWGASLHRHNFINHWTLVIELHLQLLFPPQRLRTGTEIFNLLMTGLASLATSIPILWLPRPCPKTCLINITKDTFYRSHQEILRVLGTLYQEQGQRLNISFLL